MIPKSYKIQSGCWNCKHTFLCFDYEGPDSYYCTFAMNEEIDYTKSDKKIEKELDAWEEWSNNRYVHPQGICDSYQIK